MNIKISVELSLEQARAVRQLCDKKALTPQEILLDASGIQQQPFNFAVEDFVTPRKYNTWDEITELKPQSRTRYLGGQGEQKRVYLKLLSQLFKWNESKVSAVLSQKHGTSWVYFSKSKKEILQSGNNINAHPIPGTSWFACTHSPKNQKTDILYEVLSELGFNPEYSKRISRLVSEKQPRFNDIFQLANTEAKGNTGPETPPNKGKPKAA
jgi:negative regulator of replication initiation